MIFLKSFKTAPEVFKINFIFPNGDKYGKHTLQLLFPIYPFLHTRRGLTLLSQLCRDSAIRVRSGAFEARRGTLRFLPQLVMRPSSIAPNPVEFREALPNSTVTLTSQRHTEKLPEVTGTSRWNPGFPAATQERPRESFFNTSSGPIPLP